MKTMASAPTTRGISGAFVDPLCLLLLLLPGHLGIQSRKYVPAIHCEGMMLSPQHRYQTHSARSLLHCLTTCSSVSACVSVVHESASGLCHLGSTSATQNCSNMEVAGSGVRYYQQKVTCENGGTLSTQTGTCLCVEPYYGETCQHIFRDCGDVGASGVEGPSVHVIHPVTSPSPFRVFCGPKLGRSYLFRRKDVTVHFNRTWQEYVDGFGEVSKNDHWLGLEHVHHITGNPKVYRLTFSMVTANGSKYFAKFENFSLGGGAGGYSFSMGSNYTSSTKALDCLSPLQGAPFSTYDNDSDGSALVNCAQRYGGGWWFSGDNCSAVCSPLGSLNKVSDDWSRIWAEAFWSMTFATISLAEVVGYLN